MGGVGGAAADTEKKDAPAQPARGHETIDQPIDGGRVEKIEDLPGLREVLRCK
jgi:hypothetical protein